MPYGKGTYGNKVGRPPKKKKKKSKKGKKQMPNYNYTCKSCGHTQVEFRSMVERTENTVCNKCKSISEHSLSVPSLILTLPEDRWANEHEVLGNGVRAN